MLSDPIQRGLKPLLLSLSCLISLGCSEGTPTPSSARIEFDPARPGMATVYLETDPEFAAAMAAGTADRAGATSCAQSGGPAASSDAASGFEGLPGLQSPAPVAPPGTTSAAPDLLAATRGPAAPSPAFTLPAPRGSEQAVADLERRYGVRISGSGASGEVLRQIEAGLARYSPEQLRGLEGIQVQATTREDDPEGSWNPTGEGRGEILLYADQGRSPAVFRHTVTHELGHHMSLAARPAWGERFHGALPAVRASFPSEYATRSAAENVAENLAFSLLGADSEMRALAAWQPSDAARDLLRSEFGSRSQL